MYFLCRRATKQLVSLNEDTNRWHLPTVYKKTANGAVFHAQDTHKVDIFRQLVYLQYRIFESLILQVC
jgi:hypothetical protein